MWRPPERIRYDSHSGRWPSAAEAAASRLFSPVRIGSLMLAQRTWVPAMVPWRASEDGMVTQDVLDWYECFARGQPGAIVVEATGIRDIPSGPLLRIGHDRFLPGLRALVRRVREASQGATRLFIQIIDFLTIRRRPDPARYFAQFLTVTAQHRRAFGRIAALRDCGLATRVVTTGGIHNFEQAETVLKNGTADIVGFARQALDQRHRQVTCELWDREALDTPGVKLATDNKRRLTPPRWEP